MLLPILFLMATRIAPQQATVPFRQPQLAAAHGQIAMTFGAGPAIYFTSSSDQGKTFGPLSKVAEVSALALGRHRGPRIAILKNAIVISAIVGEKNGVNGDLTVWRSVDSGKKWTRAGVVNDVRDSAREGLHAMAADASGNLFAVWLDLRSKGTKLYGARSTDSGMTWSKNVLVYASPSGTICQCCDPALAIDETGRVSVMWRNALDGSRDFYVASSLGGLQFSQVTKLGTGTWKLDACPMDGGGLVIDNGKVLSAWRREGDIFVTGPDNSEKRVGTGKDVTIARSSRGAYVAWTKGPALEILTPKASAPQLLSPEGAFVNLVALPDGSVLAAWEAHDSIETKRTE
jgi:hypothetical protein